MACRDSRRRKLAKSIGRSATFDPTRVLGSVLALLNARSADDPQDSRVRTTMIDALQEAVSPDTLRDILPSSMPRCWTMIPPYGAAESTSG